MMRLSDRNLGRVLLTLVVVSFGALAGCATIGFGAQALFPPKVDPVYEPVKTAPLLVMVENQRNPSMSVAEVDELTGYILDDLAAYEVAPLIDREKLQELRDLHEKDMEKMTISKIGKDVGAEQVLYVDLKRSNVGTIAGVPLHGRIDVAVKVVDAKTGQTLFPKNATAAYAMSFETPLTKTVDNTDPTLMRQALLSSAGTGIGRLFHTWYPEGH
jgi:hypothetical protein